MRGREHPKTLGKKVDTFNAAHPVGTRVRYRSHPSADPLETETTTPAYLLSGHTAVIMVKDVRGCVALDAVEVIP